MISQYEKVVIQDGVYSIDYCLSQVQINFFLKPIFRNYIAPNIDSFWL